MLVFELAVGGGAWHEGEIPLTPAPTQASPDGQSAAVEQLFVGDGEGACEGSSEGVGVGGFVIGTVGGVGVGGGNGSGDCSSPSLHRNGRIQLRNGMVAQRKSNADACFVCKATMITKRIERERFIGA